MDTLCIGYILVHFYVYRTLDRNFSTKKGEPHLCGPPFLLKVTLNYISHPKNDISHFVKKM